jgi:ATP-dependent Clp protease protease subunit
MNNIKDDLLIFHSSNIYLPTRTLFLTGEICEDMFNEFIRNIHALDATSGPINIKIFSPGGDINAGKAIYDAIMGCKNLTRGIAYGEIASCATLILQAFDERVMLPNSTMMIHVGSEGYGSAHPRNLDNAVEQSRRDESWMMGIYMERIKEIKRITKKQMKDLLQFDTYLTADECLELNLIDRKGEVQ